MFMKSALIVQRERKHNDLLVRLLGGKDRGRTLLSRNLKAREFGELLSGDKSLLKGHKPSLYGMVACLCPLLEKCNRLQLEFTKS